MKKIIRKGYAVMIVMVSAFFLSACTQPFLSAKSFSKVGRDYVRCIRWMEYQGAANYMEENIRDDFLSMAASFDDLNIVDARLESLDYQSGEEEGYTTILLEYYRLPSASIRELKLRQKWTYQGVDISGRGAWKIGTPFPKIP